MLPTDFDLVNLSAAIYQTGGEEWDYGGSYQDNEIYWGLKKLEGCDVIVFRGSITFHDWYEDFRVIPVKTRVGTVHDGFYEGMEKVWAQVSPMLTQPVMVTGHSLGSAHADILTALMVADGRPPVRRAVFGSPKPGNDELAKLVIQVPGDGYRNMDTHGHDLVTDVPLDLGGRFDFDHPKMLVDVSASPSGLERLELLGYHHIALYQKAITNHWGK